MKIQITVSEDLSGFESQKFYAQDDTYGINCCSSNLDIAVNFVRGACLIAIGEREVVPNLIEFEISHIQINGID